MENKQQTNISAIMGRFEQDFKYDFIERQDEPVGRRVKLFFETEITNLLKSLMMEERKYVSKEGYRHGTCCTCSTCGFDNDSCECDYNEIVKCFNQKLRSIMGETLQE